MYHLQLGLAGAIVMRVSNAQLDVAERATADINGMEDGQYQPTQMQCGGAQIPKRMMYGGSIVTTAAINPRCPKKQQEKLARNLTEKSKRNAKIRMFPKKLAAV